MNEDMKLVKENPKRKNWNLDDGYKKGSFPFTEPYPYYAIGSGAENGLTIMLSIQEKDVNDFDPCRDGDQGFKITLHLPNEIPQVSKYFSRLSPHVNAVVAVKPKLIKTVESLQQYGPNSRKCYFESERPLKFFKVYTRRICELECLANFTKDYCGCVKFSMPSKSAKTCGCFCFLMCIQLFSLAQVILTPKFAVFKELIA